MKGKMIKELKAHNIRTNEAGKKLEHCKTTEIINLYTKHIG